MLKAFVCIYKQNTWVVCSSPDLDSPDWNRGHRKDGFPCFYWCESMKNPTGTKVHSASSCLQRRRSGAQPVARWPSPVLTGTCFSRSAACCWTAAEAAMTAASSATSGKPSGDTSEKTARTFVSPQVAKISQIPSFPFVSTSPQRPPRIQAGGS